MRRSRSWLPPLIKVLWSGHYRSVALYDLKDVMGRHHGWFRGSAQQDAHEFLMYLLDFLHEDLNEERRKQPLKVGRCSPPALVFCFRTQRRAKIALSRAG